MLRVNCFNRHTNGLKTLLYHGDSTNIDLEDIENFHIVLTTYSKVTSEWIRGKSAVHRRKWFRIVLDEGLYGFPHQDLKLISV
jgi:SNF2 family DNA or RNA helicase